MPEYAECWECRQVGFNTETGECENPMCRPGLRAYHNALKAWEKAKEEWVREYASHPRQYVLASPGAEYERLNPKPTLRVDHYQPTLAKVVQYRSDES